MDIRQLFDFLFSSQGLLLLLPMLLLIVLLVVLWNAGRRDALLRAQIVTLERTLEKTLAIGRDEEEQRAQRNREEIGSSVRGLGDTVLRMMGEMSRANQGRMDTFSSQLHGMSGSEQQHMETMRQAVEQRLERIGQMMDEKLGAQETRIETMRQTVETRMERMQLGNSEKLEQIRQTVDERLHASLDKRLGESFQMVSERLEQVYKGLGEMQTLATGVGDLKRVLTGIKTRGIWGEIQLGALLEQIMTPEQYEANAAVVPGNSERVEYAVKLPGRSGDDTPVYLPLDAKFPQEDYQRVLDATEQGRADLYEAAGKQLDQAVRAEAKRIRDKYISPPHTTDIAVMFLPVEGLFAEVLRRPGLSERIQTDYHVVIAGPTTLAALLNSMQLGFRTLAIEKRASEVWGLLGAVKTEFGRFADILARTQKKLRQASDSIEDASRKTRTIQRKLRGVEELGERETRRLIDEPRYGVFDDDDGEAWAEPLPGEPDDE